MPRLPYGYEAEVKRETRQPPPRRRILIVDDNPATGDILAEMLRLSGHVIEVACSGSHALELATHFHPDTALLDIGLPGMNGYELISRLRIESFGPTLVLIALMGYGQEQDRRRSTEDGSDHHLTKPADLNTLTNLLIAGGNTEGGTGTDNSLTETTMPRYSLETIILILVLLWLLGAFVAPFGGDLIHLLLVVILVVVIVRLVDGRRLL